MASEQPSQWLQGHAQTPLAVWSGVELEGGANNGTGDAWSNCGHLDPASTPRTDPNSASAGDGGGGASERRHPPLQPK
ncbi:unnamed protein product [Lampetra planeri]